MRAHALAPRAGMAAAVPSAARAASAQHGGHGNGHEIDGHARHWRKGGGMQGMEKPKPTAETDHKAPWRGNGETQAEAHAGNGSTAPWPGDGTQPKPQPPPNGRRRHGRNGEAQANGRHGQRRDEDAPQGEPDKRQARPRHPWAEQYDDGDGAAKTALAKPAPASRTWSTACSSTTI